MVEHVESGELATVPCPQCGKNTVVDDRRHYEPDSWAVHRCGRRDQ